MRKNLEKKLISLARHWLGDKSRKYVIVTHTNPDGDAIGSSLGLYATLTAAGFSHLDVIIPNPYPAFLSWMPHADKLLLASEHPDLAGELIRGADVVFCLDFNGLSRAEGLEEALSGTRATKILVDHHPQPEESFELLISQPGASSTAEMVFELLEATGLLPYLDRAAAECLYAGIVTDTGSFSYSCNNPRTYEITARLMSLGVDGERIQRLIYNTYSVDRMRLLGYCLSEKLVVIRRCQAAYISLSLDDLKRFNHQPGDTEGVVNYALAMKNISLAALFTEYEDHVKASFRSSGPVDVNRLARKHYHGGGHRNAAGGKSFLPLHNTLKAFEQLIHSDDFRVETDE
jgi:phosphoesterase RecJ-like protein